MDENHLLRVNSFDSKEKNENREKKNLLNHLRKREKMLPFKKNMTLKGRKPLRRKNRYVNLLTVHIISPIFMNY